MKKILRYALFPIAYVAVLTILGAAWAMGGRERANAVRKGLLTVTPPLAL